MKKQILSFILGAVVAFSITMVPAVADSISKSINVLVDYVTVTLDGQKVEVANFVHDGRTYLGLRDMGNLLGLQVDWDDETQTAILTSPGKTPVWPTHKQTIDIPISKPTSIVIDGKNIDSSWINETYNTYKKNYPSITNDELKEAILTDAKWDIFKTAMFEKYNIKETEEHKEDAQNAYNEFVESYGGKETFAVLLQNSGLELESHKNDYINGYIENQLIIKLTNYLIDDVEEIKKIKDAEKANFAANPQLGDFPKATVKHILIPSGDNAEKDAKKVLSRLKKGETFDKVLEDFKTNDPGMPESGYLVYKGSGFVPEFEEASLKLKKGEYSELVQSDYGYHIIYCLEKSETIDFNEYFEMNFSQEINTALNNYCNEWMATLKVDAQWGF